MHSGDNGLLSQLRIELRFSTRKEDHTPLMQKRIALLSFLSGIVLMASFLAATRTASATTTSTDSWRCTFNASAYFSGYLTGATSTVVTSSYCASQAGTRSVIDYYGTCSYFAFKWSSSPSSAPISVDDGYAATVVKSNNQIYETVHGYGQIVVVQTGATSC